MILGNAEKGSSQLDDSLVVTYGSDIKGPAAEARSFRMGFTPFPYEYTDEAVEYTYSNVNYHSDMVVHHFDGGVPWEEALNGSGLPLNTRLNLNKRIAYTDSGIAVYLAITPLSTYRDKMAEYWGEYENMELPQQWKDKKFSDPEVIGAYLNYCMFMVDKFEPQYFAYGIEVNMLGYHDPKAFEDYLVFLDSVYPALKSAYPDLPIFLTIQLETFNNNYDTQREVVESILPYTDYMAISTYPFGDFEDPAYIPDDWFSRLYNMAEEKPVAVTETSFPAEDLYLEVYDRTILGSPESQLEYLKLITDELASVDSRFLAWFVFRDYDALWKLMEEQGADEVFKSWRDTGLVDEEGHPRPSLGYWDKYLSLPYTGTQE